MPRKNRESHNELKANPEAKRVARAIAEEGWAHPFMTVSDPILRRLGAQLVLQEMNVRMGIVEEFGPPKRRGRRPMNRAQETNLVREQPRPLEDEAPPTLRSGPPSFDPEPSSGVELTCKGCELAKPAEDFYRSTSSRTGRQALCRPCFNARYHKRAASRVA